MHVESQISLTRLRFQQVVGLRLVHVYSGVRCGQPSGPCRRDLDILMPIGRLTSCYVQMGGTMRILIVILGYIGLYRDMGKQNGSYQTRVLGSLGS